MNKVIVKINGSEYPMVGEKSEIEMLRVARYVDEEMRKSLGKNPKLSTSQAAVLTAINITDIFFECCDENEKLIKENDELNKKVGTTDGELRLEIKKLQLKLLKHGEDEEKTKKSMNDLNQLVDDKNKEIEELRKLLASKEETITSLKSDMEEFKKNAEEAKHQAKLSQQMSSKFQNDAYRVQLEKIEIENELKLLRARA